MINHHDSSHLQQLRELIEQAYEHRERLSEPSVRDAVIQTVRLLDEGVLRVAEPIEQGEWTTHAWVKEAVLLYFAVMQMEQQSVGPFEFFDKIPLKHGYQQDGVRVVPPGVVRFGAHLEKGVVLMPGYINIGARVGQRTMIDTWATVGSCAQVGADCHIAGGAGIGGVLEPPGARPVIIEDGVFVGSRAVIVEGTLVETEAVIGAGVVLTASTPILDVSTEQVQEYRGRIPARSVVIPGIRNKTFPAGTFGVPCALIIGKRKKSTDRKVSLNEALREFSVSV